MRPAPPCRATTRIESGLGAHSRKPSNKIALIVLRRGVVSLGENSFLFLCPSGGRHALASFLLLSNRDICTFVLESSSEANIDFLLISYFLSRVKEVSIVLGKAAMRLTRVRT